MAKSGQARKLYYIDSFRNQVKALEECETMVRYAQSQGKKVPSHVLKQLSDLNAIAHELEQSAAAGNTQELDPRSLNMALLGELHRDMAAVIAPATPATVLLMEDNRRKGVSGILGPVPLVRRLNIITLLCLLTFFALFAVDWRMEEDIINSFTINGDIFSYSGWKFVVNELVILCMAALGASFYALFEVYKYITKNSYDPKYDSIYWIRFVLGIVSGVILAQFIFVDPAILGDPDQVAAEMRKSRELGGFVTYKPLLAFLGGFSARVVHKILNSMVEAIETFISGSTRDMVTAREEAAKVKMEQQISSIKRTNAQAAASQRMEATVKLMQLKEEMTQGTASQQDIAFRLSQLMNEYMEPVSNTNINFHTPHPNAGPVFNNPVQDPSNPPTSVDNVPVVDHYQPGVNDFQAPIVDNDAANLAQIHDVDEIDIPDFPEDLDNPDFPMPGDIDDNPDFNANKLDPEV
ncbi:MAG: hypothetical protein AB8E82_13495 [Aureispira sp.]